MTDVELFGRILPRADVARITCLVCRRYEHADRARPALCEHCGRDVEATSLHIASVLLSTENRVTRTMDAFHAALEGAPPEVRVRWDAYVAARIDGDARATQVEAPFNKLMEWALPIELSKDGSVLARAAETAKGDMGYVEALMPSKSPTRIAMKYKGRTFAPLVIESIGMPLSSPVDASGRYVELAVPMTLCTLTAIDRKDWGKAISMT